MKCMSRWRPDTRKRSPTGKEALEKPVRPSPEPNKLVENDRRKSGGNWLQKSQVGPLRLHLLGVRRRFYPDPLRRRCSIARKNILVLRWINQKLMSRFSMTDMGDVSLVLGMSIARDREKGR